MVTKAEQNHISEARVDELDRDRFARVTRVTIGQKSIVTPNYLTRISSYSELALFMHLKNDYQTGRLGGIVVRFTDAPRVLPKREKLRQLALDHRIVKNKFDLFFETNALVVDPATEYLYYNYHMGEFYSNPSTPKVIIDYLDEVEKAKKEHRGKSLGEKRRLHAQFWNDVIADDKISFRLVDDFLKFDRSVGADFLIAPVPYINSPQMLPTANKINYIGSQLAKGKGQFGSYYPVSAELLSNAVFLEELAESLLDGNRISFLKFKGMDLTKPDRDLEERNFKDFLSTLSYICKESPQKVFCLLEAGPQIFPCAAHGFDIVSSAMCGYDSDGGFSDEHPSFGLWRDYASMALKKHTQVVEAFEANHRHIPCPCYVCKKTVDIDKMTVEEWNDYRRLNNTAVPDKWLEEIATAIQKRQMELSRQRLVRSRLKVLSDLIPSS